MLSPGTVVAGYRIERSLGQGGMGVVYEATQLSLNRTVALKFLAAHFSQDVDFRERFRREGVIQAGIDHPHIVPVYEAGEVEDGLFLAMRLIRGSNLKELILSGDVDLGRTLRILAPVADALAVAHEAGLTHRDIKPQNILVGARDHSYLADFGLTKGPDVISLTRTGQFLGTLDYVAPETINGQRATDRSDTYALAAVLYECLTGQVPYKRPSEAAVLFAHVSDPPPLVSEHRVDLPPALDEVIARGMAKQPEERYASPVDLLDDAAQVIAARSTSTSTRAPSPPVDRDASPQPSPPPAPTTLASDHAIAPTVPSEHQIDAAPLEAVAEHESTALLTPPDGTAVVPQVQEPAATTELEHAAPETPPVPDWGLEAESSGTEFDWGRGTRDTEPLAEGLSHVDEVAARRGAARRRAARRGAAPRASGDEPRDETPPRRARSRWPLAAGAVALLGLAVAVAIVAGGGGGSGGGSPAAPTPAAPRQATASGIGLRYPTTWQPGDAPPDALPGTSARWPIALAPVGAPAGTLVLAGRLPSRGSTLLPADLVAALGGDPPAATPVRLGTVDAYRYTGLAPRGSERRADVYVVPTSAGVVTLACVAAATPPPSFASDCERILESLAISGAQTYPLGPDRAFAKRLNGAMTALNARRGSLRKRLRAEHRAAGQARDAGGLARAFTSAAGTAAAGTVSPAVAPDRTVIVKAMRRAAADYRALAHAAAHHDRRAYNRARTGVRRAERTLSRALRHLDRRSYTVA